MRTALTLSAARPLVLLLPLERHPTERRMKSINQTSDQPKAIVVVGNTDFAIMCEVALFLARTRNAVGFCGQTA